MTKSEKQNYLNKKSIGYWSALGGAELKKIIYGINDYAVIVIGAWSSQKSVHRVKINYGNKRDYITIHGYRLYIDECIRM